MVHWAWILRLCKVALAIAKAPAPRFNAICSRCLAARDGIHTLHTYLHTQLPFAYVHLITLLVNLQNVVSALKCGVLFARAKANGDFLACLQEVFICELVCFIYQGLLEVSYVVQNPFGRHLLDFPLAAYNEYCAESCVAVSRPQSLVPALLPERGLLPLDLATKPKKAEHSPRPAGGPAAPAAPRRQAATTAAGASTAADATRAAAADQAAAEILPDERAVLQAVLSPWQLRAVGRQSVWAAITTHARQGSLRSLLPLLERTAQLLDEMPDAMRRLLKEEDGWRNLPVPVPDDDSSPSGPLLNKVEEEEDDDDVALGDSSSDDSDDD